MRQSGSESPAAGLTEVEGLAWSALESAVRSAKDGLHTCAVATVDADGWPQCRTVVLREADRAMRVVGFHTDVRSPKVRELRASPRATLLFYDPGRKLQLRLACEVTVHTDDAIADGRWAASAASSRRCYSAAAGSSERVDAPPAAPTDAVAGRLFFAAVRCAVKSLEWLELAYDGHRRARIGYPPAGQPDCYWLAP